MKIEQIVLDTGRSITSLEEKIWLSSIFLFAEQKSDEVFASLLFSDDKREAIREVEEMIEPYEVSMDIDTKDEQFLKAVEKTADKIKEKLKKEYRGYLDFLKALYEGNEFAKAIADISKAVDNLRR